MANTVIQLKHSTITGNVPSSLANGEISINNRDGKFFYSTPANVVITHYPYLGPAGLNKEIQFNDSGTLGSSSGLEFDKVSGSLNVSNAIIVNGRNLDAYANAAFLKANTPDYVANSASSYANSAFAKANNALANTSGTVFDGDLKIGSGGKLIVLPVGGDEGGEILLDKPPNGTLGGGVTIDAYQDKLRIFEQGGTARGVYIDLTQAAGGVGTNLLNPTATPDEVARSTANAAFLQANSAFTVANNAFTSTNGSIAWATANSAGSYANAAFAVANSSATYANSSFLQANTPSYTANSAALYANGAFASSNNAVLKSGSTLTGK
jgi:hypothetical protein